MNYTPLVDSIDAIKDVKTRQTLYAIYWRYQNNAYLFRERKGRIFQRQLRTIYGADTERVLEEQYFSQFE